ncbi:MAG: hypothetical protein HC835_04670 [Oscillatoriales cyanobacterium RM2_1_1]|nr:hypothetical protein [Oscillatoriales cyanobacterium SM2_3_0]NJO44962.1 hypothetical protein [Oscillatoriales cyanobacterium RM2_1_1]
MSRIYTTKELIQILDEERKACLKGQRLNLRATPTVGNPVIDYFLKPEGIQKFTAYQDFKAAIHRYQLENNVSGIIWQEATIHGKTLRYPVVDDQLMALPEDLQRLKAAKPELLHFWHQITEGMNFYLSLNSGKDYQEIQAHEIEAIAQRTEWACLWKWEKSDFLEMLLQLGWGQPGEAKDRRGWPGSGSENIHAVKPGQRPIC